MDDRALIRIEDVAFRYRRDPVLVDIELSIQPGDFLAVIGPNGSGKTTLIKIMLGLLAPSSGTVSLFGTPIREFRNWERVGYVPQKATLTIPTREVRQEPAFVSRLLSLGAKAPRGTRAWTRLNR